MNIAVGLVIGWDLNNKLTLKNMSKKTIITIITIIVIVGLGYGAYRYLSSMPAPEEEQKQEEEEGEPAELPNPAAVYCLEIGGELMQVVDEKGAAGYCILPDDRICAQWKLFNSEGEECVPPEEPAEASSNNNMITIMQTNFGEIKIELFLSDAPETVGNFVKLAESGFYNDTKFHRVIKGFMIQGGDPLTKDDSLKERWGTGGPGYSFLDEIHSNNHNVVGTISMANAGPNTNGSQFFINTDNNDFLDTKHTVFGKVIEGMDVVRSIENVSTQGPDRPVDNVIIQSIKVND